MRSMHSKLMLQSGIKQIRIKQKPKRRLLSYTLIKCQQMHLINSFIALSSPTVDGKPAELKDLAWAIRQTEQGSSFLWHRM